MRTESFAHPLAQLAQLFAPHCPLSSSVGSLTFANKHLGRRIDAPDHSEPECLEIGMFVMDQALILSSWDNGIVLANFLSALNHSSNAAQFVPKVDRLLRARVSSFIRIPFPRFRQFVSIYLWIHRTVGKNNTKSTSSIQRQKHLSHELRSERLVATE